MRKHVDTHLRRQCRNRNYECQYCGMKGTFASIVVEHDRVCQLKVVPCPNTECYVVMERRSMKRHIQTLCDCTIVACKHESIGCSVKKMRRDIKKHEEEDDKPHLHLALDHVAVVSSEITSMKETTISTLNQGEPFTIRLSGLITKNLNQSLSSLVLVATRCVL